MEEAALGFGSQDILCLWLSTALPAVQRGSQVSFNSGNGEKQRENCNSIWSKHMGQFMDSLFIWLLM